MGRGVKVAEQSRESDGLKKPSLEQMCNDVGNGRGEKEPNAINLYSRELQDQDGGQLNMNRNNVK